MITMMMKENKNTFLEEETDPLKEQVNLLMQMILMTKH